MDKRELVRSFFEDKDYLSAASAVCEPDIDPAIEEYMLDQRRDLKVLNFTRLASIDINHVPTLRAILFQGLDRWAEAQFNFKDHISVTLEGYIYAIHRSFKDRLSPENYTDSDGLGAAHVEILKQYLNQAFQDKSMAALWVEHFPSLFEDWMRRTDFAVVFLLMMLDRNQCRTSPYTKLRKKPLAMLMRCGYAYVAGENCQAERPRQHTILCVLVETAVRNKFYLCEDHREEIVALIYSYLLFAGRKDAYELMRVADETLWSIIHDAVGAIMCHLKDLMSYYEETAKVRHMLELASSIPKECVAHLQPKWSQVLAEAEKYEW